MKKQESKNIAAQDLQKIAQSHKLSEVSPPQSANKDMLTGKYNMTAKDAVNTWFDTAKTQNPSSGFLDVPSENLKPLAGSDREMLYKGKKKGK